ncbi:hypothetical protein Val02_66970 [Virgisporangium aliadipatigenens]|uniref:Uncharacterized protein n=1 Tax=Virgisporangium aliadipatigenens TaxID=741659 RepID=A0A8J4DTZ4_9ACTN|nr:hypothetical protein [Virgisporangium aliadipatigenens]GIJ49811.1 hypothetical protein Val02_66970 [Virgisporangium aliadipatigenens]
MLIDCETCTARGAGCADCALTALFTPPVEVEVLDRDELWAVEILTRAGFEVEVLEPHDEPVSPTLPLLPRTPRARRAS